jgi:hypothetical protein
VPHFWLKVLLQESSKKAIKDAAKAFETEKYGKNIKNLMLAFL